MSALEAAQRYAVLKVLKDQVEKAYESARTAASAAMDPGDRKVAVLDDGTVIGSITMTRPGDPKARVDHSKNFLRWVAANHSDEVVLTVRSSFQRRVLDVCNEEGAIVWPRTGETIPGVSFGEPSQSRPQITQSEDEAAAVVEAWTAGKLEALLRGTPLAEIEVSA